MDLTPTAPIIPKCKEFTTWQYAEKIETKPTGWGVKNTAGGNLTGRPALMSRPNTLMEEVMKRFVIQRKKHSWDTAWIMIERLQYDTLEEAKAAFEGLPIKADHRIAESYTVTRYKAVRT